jgi:hypothetical protein
MTGTGKCILAALFVIAIRNSRKAQPCAGIRFAPGQTSFQRL